MTGDCADNNNCVSPSLHRKSDGLITAVVTVGANELFISSSSEALVTSSKEVLDEFFRDQTKERAKKSGMSFSPE